jgi:16S rRNA (guanine527-N7)-methyltransferase
VTSDEFQRALHARLKTAKLTLSPGVGLQLENYYRLLLHWNARMNLTVLPLEPLGAPAIDRLFVEPLSAACSVADKPLRWLDLGSGGGSPAVPLKLVRPAAVLTMVESRSRKAAFLRETVRTLRLTTADVRNCRYEQLASEAGVAGSVDLVTARAVRLDEAFFGCARTLLRDSGLLLLLGGGTESPEIPFGFELSGEVPFPKPSSGQVLVLRRAFHVER